MKLIRYNQKLNNVEIPPAAQNAVIALGNFDGVHRGHQEIIKQTIAIARASNQPSAVMSFEPHPSLILRENAPALRIADFSQKFRLIADLGIDYMICMRFNCAFSQLTAHEFVTNILVDYLHVSHIIIGDDFIFGNKRGGNADLLRGMSAQHDFKLTQIQAVKHEGDAGRFASRVIRSHLREGDIAAAKAALGHDFIIEGRVRKGAQKGRTIGVPTANISLKQYLRPRFGVYFCDVNIGDKTYHGISNIGTKPTVDGTHDLLEVHILNFDEDIYDKKIAVTLLQFHRDEKKFDNFPALQQQIMLDIESARKYFSTG